LAVADFNRDGRPDVAGAISGYIRLFPGLGNGVLGDPTGWFVSAVALAIGDFNNDERLDLVSVSSYNVRILFGDGAGGFLVSSNVYGAGYPSVFYPRAVAVGDFNSDRKADLAIVYSLDYPGCLVTFGRGNGSFDPPTKYTLANDPRDLRVGDLNGDGRPDLAIALRQGNSNTFCILTNKGDGTFGSPQYYLGRSGDDHPSLELGDFNGDRRLDVAVLEAAVSRFSNSVAIWLNNGRAGFDLADRYLLGFSPAAIVAADLNGDGKTDLLVRGGDLLIPPYGGPSARVLLGQGDGSFVVGAAFSVPAPGIYPGTLGVGDFNGDGTPDLALTSATDETVAIMLNQTPPYLEIVKMEGYNQITWLATFGAGFTLEYTTNLLAPSAWQPFPYPPVVLGNQKGVTDWADHERKFYRLRKP
jgi:hypothetical protein